MVSSGDRSITVLHVDDEPDFADLVSVYLEREDGSIDVITGHSADEGLARLDETDVDCIVSDYQMPGVDGLEFLETVRERYGDLPFILFTGKGSEEIASDAISAGVTDYLQKEGGTDQYAILANRIRNVVERRRAQRERERSERHFEAIFDDPHMLVGVLDPDGTLRQANRTAMELIDADLDEVVGEPFWATPWWPDEVRADVQQWVERATRGEYVEFEAAHTTPDGDRRSVLGTLRPVRDDRGEVVSLIASGRDITEREKHERRLETLIENLPGVVYRCRNEPDWPMEFVSGECEALTGYPSSALETGEVRYGSDVIHPDDRDEVWDTVQEALDDREPFELTYRIIAKDDTRKWVWERGRGIRSSDGDVEALEGFISDITARKE